MQLQSLMCKIQPDDLKKIREYEKSFPSRHEFFKDLLKVYDNRNKSDDQKVIDLIEEVGKITEENKVLQQQLQAFTEENNRLNRQLEENSQVIESIPESCIELTEKENTFLSSISNGNPKRYILDLIISLCKLYPKKQMTVIIPEENYQAYQKFIQE